MPLVRELTRGVMADRVVLTPWVVHADMILPAMMLTRKGGTCVLTGIMPTGEMVPTSGCALRRHEPTREHADVVVHVSERAAQT
jgi:hypothetical protein